ncbi:hypothetical protein C84B14_08757 [Salinisphaera sp. C84B14]|uniref:hypothetical protein n=1 Tax=Salinisphaera sp. C84B14 TaxID=1304155 RepID=UPI0033401AED
MNDHHIVGRFPFTREGHANRRDADAEPRIAVVSIDVEDKRLHYHEAGDEYVRAIDLHKLKLIDPLIEGMEPRDAFMAGVWCEVAMQERRAQRDEQVA